MIDIEHARAFLASRRRELEGLLAAAQRAGTAEGDTEARRLAAALEEVNLIEVCLFSPGTDLVLYG